MEQIMTGAFSPEMQISGILREIGCAQSNFSELADRGANSRVIAGLRGTNDFSAEDGAYYLHVAREMKKLADDAGVPINWKEVPRIKEILAARRTATRPVPFAVIFIGPALFKEVISGKVQTTTSYQDCAAFNSPLVAMTAAKILNVMGERNLNVQTITNQVRDAGTIFSELQDFGFAQ
jgi:hypothetical protein